MLLKQINTSLSVRRLLVSSLAQLFRLRSRVGLLLESQTPPLPAVYDVVPVSILE